MDLSERRELNRGIGDGLARAFELAVTPVVFGAMGHALDRVVDVVPVFTIVFAAFAVVGMFVRLWYGYDLEMKRHEAQGAWAKRP